MAIGVADAQEYVRIFEGICREQRVKNYYIQCHKVSKCLYIGMTSSWAVWLGEWFFECSYC